MATWPIIIDDDGTGTSGTPTDKAIFDAIKAYIDVAAFPPVQSYVPIFKAGGAAFLPGATIAGAYQLITNNLVWFEAKLTLAGTNIPNVGGWTVSVPFAFTEGLVSFRGLAFNSVSTYQILSHSIGYATECALMVPTSPLSSVTNTVPFTWTDGNVLHLDGIYRRT